MSSFRRFRGSSTRIAVEPGETIFEKAALLFISPGDGLHDASEVPEDFDLDRSEATWQRPSHDAPNGLMRAVPKPGHNAEDRPENHAGNIDDLCDPRVLCGMAGLRLPPSVSDATLRCCAE